MFSVYAKQINGEQIDIFSRICLTLLKAYIVSLKHFAFAEESSCDLG